MSGHGMANASGTGGPALAAAGPRPVSARVRTILAVIALAGLLAFLIALLWGNARKAWMVFLIDFLFFTGIAQAGVVIAAMLQLTGARWGRPVKRLAEALGAFLPVSFVFFLVLCLGAGSIFPWAGSPPAGKEVWLGLPFLISRGILALLVLNGLSLVFVYFSARPDLGLAAESDPAWKTGWARFLLRNWRGLDAERARSDRVLGILSPVLLLSYAIVYTILALDWIMALDPTWVSTLFGAYYFMTNLYLGFAALAIATVIFRSRWNLREAIGPDRLHDLGKLLLGFCLVGGDFFWSQFLVIWYGNLPEEMGFVARRLESPLSKVVLVLAFLVPFTLLLSRATKRNPLSLSFIAACAIVGVFLERVLLVAPSLPDVAQGMVPINIGGWAMIAGTLAILVLSTIAFLSRVPVLPISDPLLGPEQRK